MCLNWLSQNWDKSSTEAYDRGNKFKFYQTIKTLKEYLLISSQSVGVDLYTKRADDRWLLTSLSELNDVVELQSVGCRLPLATLYKRVRFGEPEGPDASPLVK